MNTSVLLPRWLTALLALAALGILSGGGYFFREQERRQRNAVLNELEVVTELKALKIVEWRRNRLGDAERMRALLACAGPEWGVPAGPHSEQAHQRLAACLRALVDGETYQRAFLVDERLNVRSAAPLPPTGEMPALSAALRPSVGEALRSGQAMLTDLYRAEANGPVQTAVVIPLGEPGLGALILESHAGSFLFPLLAFWPTPATSKETLLVRREGDSVLYLNDLRFQPNTALNLRAPLTDTARLAVKAVLGLGKGLTHGVDYRGERVVAVLESIPDSPWFIESKLDEAEAFAGARTTSMLILGWIFGSLALAGGTVALIWQGRSRTHMANLYAAEAARREGEAHYLHLVETAAEGIWSGDAALRTTSASKRLEQMVGGRVGGLLGVPLRELVHPEDADRVANPDNFPPGRFRQVECRLSEAGGGPRWVLMSTSARADAQGQRTEVLATMTDITELKRAQSEIGRQAALLDAASDAIYVRTLDHKVTYWNGGAERLYGYSRADALGHDVRELGRPNSEAFAAAHAELLERGHWAGELMKHNKTGRPICMFCRWTVLRNAQGQPEAVLAINTDVTEKKELEARFLRVQRLETIGVLSGGIAHDLNNILAPILMTSSLLKETTQDPEQRAMLKSVEACARRGATITRQLLYFARGKPEAKVVLPLRQLLRDTKKFVAETFPRRIKTDATPPGELWPVLGDATQIHQVLMNLCVNARDAMPEGGTLTLAGSNVAVDAAFAAVPEDAKPGKYVRLMVADTGTGIAPENLERIFEPFFTTKEVGRGTGLGLCTVLGIVRGHGGFLRVDSHVGRGSAFEVYLPVTHEAGARAHDTAVVEAPARGQNQLVLVVDDEAAMCRTVRTALTRHGYRVLTAAQGEEALALFTQHRAEVRAVVTDMMMPGMDGPELTRRLRQLDEHLPVIGMSGLVELLELERHQDLPFAAMLAKPFSTPELVAALEAALGAPEAPTEQTPRPDLQPREADHHATDPAPDDP
ncbi:MAG TPA: PAS domain S-box protein [Longimicrobiales bacterium]|nr:PAS domain S-box protein [Longimicrobiales bacterium]